MDLNFTWKKHHLTAADGAAKIGKVIFHAVVPTPGFEVFCEVDPNNDGNSYDWSVHSRVINRRGRISWLGCKFRKHRAFAEPTQAVTDVEDFLRSEMAKCLLGEGSLFTLWREELARDLTTYD